MSLRRLAVLINERLEALTYRHLRPGTATIGPMHADVIVIGLGAMGAAIIYQLARRGVAVTGIDRYIPPHDMGSTHGDTRVTRQAVGEGAEYVPLVARSHQIWHELATETGEQVLHPCGVLLLAPPEAGVHGVESFVETTAALARRFRIDHEMLDASAVASRFPQFALDAGEIGYFELGGGFTRPELAVRVQLAQARRYRATLRYGTTVVSVHGHSTGVDVVTADGDRQAAGTVVVATGPWMDDLAPPPLRAQLRVCRQVLYWYHVDHDVYPSLTAPQLPVFLWFRHATGLYGFPAVNGPDGGLKVGYHDYTTTVSASAPKTPVSDAEVHTMYRDRVGGRIRGVRPQPVRAVTCYYTMTSDHRFVIDRSPDNDHIVFVSACSGHGFKHSAGIGDAVAQLITTGASNIDLKPFTLARFDYAARTE